MNSIAHTAFALEQQRSAQLDRDLELLRRNAERTPAAAAPRRLARVLELLRRRPSQQQLASTTIAAR